MTEATPATPAGKPRHDAFEGDRKRKFLDALGNCGCVRDAARKAGVSHQTVYNHQARDPGFARQCELALDMAGADVELHAWERGVVGIKEPVFDRAGEVVGYRLKRSDNILRLLLQGTKRKKYGPNPGFKRKQLLKVERKRVLEEVRAEWNARHAPPPIEEVEAALHETVARLRRGIDKERLAAGWTPLDDGEWVPPGWVRAEGWAALARPDERPRDGGEYGPESV